jgi:hypothetical protein
VSNFILFFSKARLDFWESRAEWLPSWQFGGAELLVDYIKIYAI